MIPTIIYITFSIAGILLIIAIIYGIITDWKDIK